jgi:hypothetical protein
MGALLEKDNEGAENDNVEADIYQWLIQKGQLYGLF